MTAPKTPANEPSPGPWRAAGFHASGVVVDANGQTVANVMRTADMGPVMAAPAMFDLAARAAGTLSGCATIFAQDGYHETATKCRLMRDELVAALGKITPLQVDSLMRGVH